MRIGNKSVSFTSHYIVEGQRDALDETLWYLQKKHQEVPEQIDFLAIKMPSAPVESPVQRLLSPIDIKDLNNQEDRIKIATNLLDRFSGKKGQELLKAEPLANSLEYMIVTGQDKQYIQAQAKQIVETSVYSKKPTYANLIDNAKKLLSGLAQTDEAIAKGKPIEIFTSKAIKEHLPYLSLMEIPKFSVGGILDRIKTLQQNTPNIEQRIFSALV